MKNYAVSFLLVGILLAFSYVLNADKRNIASILNAEKLPDGLEILDHATFAWTDYREEYVISFTGDYELLLSGREFSLCEPDQDSIEASSGLKNHNIVTLAHCYQTGNWQSEMGFVRVLFDDNKLKAVIIFDQD